MNYSIIFTLILVVNCMTASAKITLTLTGSSADVGSNLILGGPIVDNSGGANDVDQKFQDVIDVLRGCTGSACPAKIDVVVLQAGGKDIYGTYIYGFFGVNSVRCYAVTKVADGNDPTLVSDIQKAEYVFFNGGNQCDYVTLFKGTGIQTAVNAVIARGGAVGGTSAGMAILGNFIYDACSSAQGVSSSSALVNPYDNGISFTYNFFSFPNMQLTFNDQHFVARDRMGRLLVFLARQIKDGKATTVWGVATNQESSIVVESDGIATTMGNDGVTQYGNNIVQAASVNAVSYYILLDHACQTVVAGTPLTCSGYKVWKRLPGQTFDLANRPTTNPDYTLNVNAGVIAAVGNGGNIY